MAALGFTNAQPLAENCPKFGLTRQKYIKSMIKSQVKFLKKFRIIQCQCFAVKTVVFASYIRLLFYRSTIFSSLFGAAGILL